MDSQQRTFRKYYSEKQKGDLLIHIERLQSFFFSYLVAAYLYTIMPISRRLVSTTLHNNHSSFNGLNETMTFLLKLSGEFTPRVIIYNSFHSCIITKLYIVKCHQYYMI